MRCITPSSWFPGRVCANQSAGFHSRSTNLSTHTSDHFLGTRPRASWSLAALAWRYYPSSPESRCALLFVLRLHFRALFIAGFSSSRFHTHQLQHQHWHWHWTTRRKSLRTAIGPGAARPSIHHVHPKRSREHCQPTLALGGSNRIRRNSTTTTSLHRYIHTHYSRLLCSTAQPRWPPSCRS